MHAIIRAYRDESIWMPIVAINCILSQQIIKQNKIRQLLADTPQAATMCGSWVWTQNESYRTRDLDWPELAWPGLGSTFAGSHV